MVPAPCPRGGKTGPLQWPTESYTGHPCMPPFLLTHNSVRTVGLKKEGIFRRITDLLAQVQASFFKFLVVSAHFTKK